MREAEPPICYLVGTPRARLSKLQAQLLEQPWKDVRPGLEVKLLAQEKELYILALSRQRLSKERAIRRRRLKKLWHRPAELRQMRPESRPASDQAWPSQRRSRPAGFIHIPARVKAFVLSVNSVAFRALETFKRSFVELTAQEPVPSQTISILVLA